MPRSPPQRTLAHVLASDPSTAAWTARHRDEAAVTRLLRRHLPRSIGERARVADTRDGVLEIAVSGGSIATALRQRVPDLRSALARDGWTFVEVRVRVQVPASAPTGAPPPGRQWDSHAAAPLFDLADQLPGGALKDALRRWSRRARGR